MRFLGFRVGDLSLPQADERVCDGVDMAGFEPALQQFLAAYASATSHALRFS